MHHSPVNLYVGQVVYEMKCHNKWLMRFLVAQHLDALLKVYHHYIRLYFLKFFIVVH